MKKLSPLFFALLCCLCGNYFAQTITPYLQAATPNSIVATWKTGATTIQSKVRLGLSPSTLSSVFTGTTQIMTDAGYSNNYYYHHVKIKNLTANTKYYYRIISGTDSSAVFSFKTFPNPGTAATASGH